MKAVDQTTGEDLEARQKAEEAKKADATPTREAAGE
jgi:polyribonucleotide nucleotidyltransferase